MSKYLLSLIWFLVGCSPIGFGGSPEPEFTPTYHRDIRPLIDRHCGGCHRSGGAAIVLDGTPALTPLILSKVDAGLMPPWMPGPLSQPMVGDLSLSQQDKDLLHAWATAGSPAGNQADYHPPSVPSSSSPTLALRMATPFHPKSGDADQYRCFVLPGLPGGWITKLAWDLGHPSAAHHVGGIVIDGAGLMQLQSRGLAGPDGFDCPADFGPAPAIAGLSSTGVGGVPGFTLPSDVGIEAPIGGAIVMQIHYVPGVPTSGDVSGVSLWIDQGPKAEVREFQFVAPVEVPCGTGVSRDPSNRCSRQWAFDHDGLRTPAQAEMDSNLALTRCGQTLAGHYQRLQWQTELGAVFQVPADCTTSFPASGELLGVHLHMHTRGVSGKIEIETPSGTWQTVLDIPRWRWPWESGYQLRDPIPVTAGQRVRVSCVIDNGFANQWGQGGPGHDGPAVPPLESPEQHVGGNTRNSEMCAAFLQVIKRQLHAFLPIRPAT